MPSYFVVTVALGCTLATITLSADVAPAQGVLALALLIALQFVMTWSSRSLGLGPALDCRGAVTAVVRGQFLQSALRRTRLTEEAARSLF